MSVSVCGPATHTRAHIPSSMHMYIHVRWPLQACNQVDVCGRWVGLRNVYKYGKFTKAYKLASKNM